MEEDESLGPEDLFAMAKDGEHEPVEIAKRLVDECDQFVHLRDGEALILFLMRMQPKIKAGRQIIGTMAIPKFTGEVGPIGTWMLARLCNGLPDFIMTLDAEWWNQADPHAREALVFHELKHAIQATDKHGEPRYTEEGTPIWDILGHDIEAFNDEVERYGAWKSDITGFLAAAARGGAR